MRISVTLVFLGLVYLAAPASAQTSNDRYLSLLKAKCEATLGPTFLNVDVHEMQVTDDNSRSIAEITASRRADRPQLGTATLGLTIVNMKSEWDAKSHMIGSAQQPVVCMRPVINLTLLTTKHTVLIANVYRYGTCAYNAVREHEYKHVQANHDTVIRLRDQLQEELQAYYGTKIYYGTQAQLNAWMSDSISKKWNPRITALRTQIHDEIDTIDTPAEYARVNQKCDGEVNRIARQAP